MNSGLFEATRSLVHIRDVLRAFSLALGKERGHSPKESEQVHSASRRIFGETFTLI